MSVPEAPTPGQRDISLLTDLFHPESPCVSRETLSRLESYADRLCQWQSRINLISSSTIPDLWRRHIIDSAQIYPHIHQAKTCLDIGSGAGFPGLVISLLAKADQKDLTVTLVESDGRKAAFLLDIINRLELSATVIAKRVEDLAPWPCDVVTARACAPLHKILAYGAPFLADRPEGEFVLLKGKTAEEELTVANEWWKFQADRIQSRTDPGGVVLRLKAVERHVTPGQPQNHPG